MPRTRTVTLTEFEQRFALQAGEQRQIENMAEMRDAIAKGKKKREDAFGAESSIKGAGLHMVGCLGELAAAKWLGVYWHPHEFAIVDVGPCQVRTTEYENGDLCLHDTDKDKHIFILAYAINVKLPRIGLAGWAYAYEGKQKKWWKDIKKGLNREAYWMPPEKLHDMGDLMKELRNPLT